MRKFVNKAGIELKIKKDFYKINLDTSLRVKDITSESVYSGIFMEYHDYNGTWDGSKAFYLIEKIKDMKKIEEKINHPSHYQIGDNTYEVIKVIKAWEMNYTEGNIIKYVSRYKKNNGIEDLKKAKWYLDYLINTLEAKVKKPF